MPRSHPLAPVALALALFAGERAGAQALTRPKTVAISAHIVVTQPLDATPARIASLRVPPGFKVTTWASGLGTPRAIAVAPNGDVYVSDTQARTITLLRGTATATSRKLVLAGVKDVLGLALHDGRLYYAAGTETFAAPILADGSLGPGQRIAADLPDLGQHNDRTIGFGPDNMLYESVGSTCNECEEQNPESAAMLRMNPDGTGRAVFASGLRNTIGFAFRPGTTELYGWDDGVDWLGDDAQREELNLIARGREYGWPYVLGDGQLNYYRDPPKGQGTVAQWDAASARPLLTYTAHASGMQLAFYTGAMFPADYRGDAFATLHGSWNRSPPSGYEVVRIHFANGRPTSIQPFLTGFLTRSGDQWARFARPFGLAVLPDGSLLVGEDQNGMIYRVSYAGR